jgi:hypothetical protein
MHSLCSLVAGFHFDMSIRMNLYKELVYIISNCKTKLVSSNINNHLCNFLFILDWRVKCSIPISKSAMHSQRLCFLSALKAYGADSEQHYWINFIIIGFSKHGSNARLFMAENQGSSSPTSHP